MTTELKEAQPPHVVKESTNIDVTSNPSKRMRISHQYMSELQIDSVRDNSGVYEGDTAFVKLGESQQPVKVKQGKGAMLFANGDFYNGDWEKDHMHGVGTYYYSNDNYFYSGAFRESEQLGRGLYFYSDSQDFYMGEVFKGQYHGKGLFYNHEADAWELCLYKDGDK